MSTDSTTPQTDAFVARMIERFNVSINTFMNGDENTASRRRLHLGINVGLRNLLAFEYDAIVNENGGHPTTIGKMILVIEQQIQTVVGTAAAADYVDM